MFTRLATLSLAVILILTACAAPAAPAPTPVPPTSAPAATPTSTSITVTDALGRKVTFAKPPQRIIVVGKALFMIADAIYLFPEAPSRVAAIGKTMQNKVDFIPVIDPNYASKTILESSAGAEQIAAAKPDLVLLKSSVAESLGEPVEALGIPVVYIDFETPEQYWRDMTTLGQLFQNEARAKQLIAFFQQRVDRVTKAVADLKDDQKPRVLLLYYSEKSGAVAFNIPPLQWMQSMLVQTGGGQPAWKDAQLGQGWTTVTLEQIATWDADQIYIIVYSGNVNDAIKKLKADPQWQALRAVKQGKLYGFPADYYSWDQPDTRWILGLTWIAEKMNPDRFKDLDMQQEVCTFYKDLYNMDDAAYQKNIQPNLVGDLP
jgi:iron complex transport system substrate-binding protein